MNKYPESKVLVTGHADKATGTAEFNQMISEKRAKVVKDYLISQGIAEDRITVKALGDTDNPYTEKGDSPVLNRVSICVIE
jgi:outer membrane protein OmpA-like peptidoglycan-associated protein